MNHLFAGRGLLSLAVIAGCGCLQTLALAGGSLTTLAEPEPPVSLWMQRLRDPKPEVRIGAIYALAQQVHQAPGDLLGIRGEFLEFDGDFDRIVVHGHTPVLQPDLRANRINIDTGAFATNKLTCLKIDEKGARVLSL